MDGGFKVVVGRKGSGKSALAHVTYDRLQEHAKTAVRVITPKGYELKQVLEVVKKTGLPMGGPVVAALWRYAIGTEALAAIWERLEGRAFDASWSVQETKIKDALGSFNGVPEFSFASRIALLAKEQLSELSPEDVAPEGRLLGQLQKTELRKLRDLVCEFLITDDWDLAIIIDDIVPRWKSAEERVEYGELLLSFLEAARSLWREWNDHLARRGGRELSTLVFVRSDIFASMLSAEQEPDRIPHETLQWEDVDSLLELVARRIDASVPETRLYWNDILDDELTFDALKKFVSNAILYRPRDVIFFFSRVLFYADRRRASVITIRDLRQAVRDYSEYALKSLTAEWCPEIPNVDDFLVSLLGGSSKLSHDELTKHLIRSHVETTDTEEAIRFLVECQFLGMSIDDFNYRYAMSPIQGDIMMRQAKRFKITKGGSNQFQVHRAFHQSLALD